MVPAALADLLERRLTGHRRAPILAGQALLPLPVDPDPVDREVPAAPTNRPNR